LASRSFAQQPANSSSIETVTVTANAEAPAIWHATKNGADVAILGIVQPLPDGFQWNTKPVEAILDTARLVLLPPHVEMGAFSGAWFYLTERDLLHPPDGKTLWDILDPQAAGRLADACNQLHEPRERYNDSSPIAAGMNLGSDFRHVYDLTTHEPEDTIRELARARRIEVRRIANYDMIPSAKELLKLPPGQTGKCIEAATDDIAFQSRHVATAATAWAAGDVTGMQANLSEPRFYDCLVALSVHAAVLDSRFIDDTVDGITDAMDGGGHSLAVVEIGILLRRNGVLDRLRSEGIAVAGPVTGNQKSEVRNQNLPDQ
jgi:hypothetical protein